MSRNLWFVALLVLAITITACSEAQPTALFLPTLPPTSTPVPHPTVTAVPAATSDTAPAASPTSDTVPSASPTSDTVPSATLTSGQITAEPPPTASPEPPAAAFPPVVGLEPWLSGFQDPVFVTYAAAVPPWESRLLVVEKAGRIILIEGDRVLDLPFLDITDRVGSSASEQGLLSVAFPADFHISRVFYVNYTDLRGDTVVARFDMLPGDLPSGDPSSEQILLEIAQPAGNHNGGQLQFGPDRYLYIGTGDGGRAGDPWGNAQNPGVLLGKMLRIDVDGAENYRIPSDNPFLDRSEVRSEIWSLGLRNPWRFSFDRVTGDLLIADVGQNAYEEVNFQPAASSGGENYGWDVMEGNRCFEPERDCDATGLTLPVTEYDHSQGCSITGGYVYRGTNYPSLRGVYLFGDFCSGKIWGLRRTSSGEWETALLLDSDLAISSFGEDVKGELYIVNYKDGTIHRLIALP